MVAATRRQDNWTSYLDTWVSHAPLRMSPRSHSMLQPLSWQWHSWQSTVMSLDSLSAVSYFTLESLHIPLAANLTYWPSIVTKCSRVKWSDTSQPGDCIFQYLVIWHSTVRVLDISLLNGLTFMLSRNLTFWDFIVMWPDTITHDTELSSDLTFIIYYSVANVWTFHYQVTWYFVIKWPDIPLSNNLTFHYWMT